MSAALPAPAKTTLPNEDVDFKANAEHIDDAHSVHDKEAQAAPKGGYDGFVQKTDPVEISE